MAALFLCLCANSVPNVGDVLAGRRTEFYSDYDRNHLPDLDRHRPNGHNLGTILVSGDSAPRRPTANPLELSARGGGRTHTALSGQGILSPSRLPVPPPGLS